MQWEVVIGLETHAQLATCSKIFSGSSTAFGAAPNTQASPVDLALPGTVELAEISGSDTFVHVDTPVGELVAQLTGVHQFELGSSVTLYLNPAQVYVFDSAGELLVAPSQGAA